MFIEIKGVLRERRFLNLDRVALVKLKQTGEIMLEPAMEVVEEDNPAYKGLLKILGVSKEKPASQTQELLEEKEG